MYPLSYKFQIASGYPDSELCSVCCDKGGGLEASQMHLQTLPGYPSQKSFAVQFPNSSITGEFFDACGLGDFPQRAEVLGVLSEQHAIFEVDGCYREVIERLKSHDFREFNLSKEEATRIHSMLLLHTQKNRIFKIGTVDLTDLDFKYGFPTHSKKKEIFDKLRGIFSSSFPYPSEGDIDGFRAAIESRIREALKSIFPLFTDEDAYEITFQIATGVNRNPKDGFCSFPSFQTLFNSFEDLLSASEVTLLAKRFGGEKILLPELKAGEPLLTEMEIWVKTTMQLQMDPTIVSFLARHIYNSGCVEPSSEEITLPSEEHLSYLLRRLPIYVSLTRENLYELALVLADKSFSYSVGPQNKKLLIHVKRYAEAILRPIGIKPLLRSMIISLWSQLAI